MPGRDTRLSAELETLLSAVGLPIARTGDRTLAAGLVITEVVYRIATVEWFVSPETRAAAAGEQAAGDVDGNATVLHRLGRTFMHEAVGHLLHELGYRLTRDTRGVLTVDGTAFPSAAEILRALIEAAPTGSTRGVYVPRHRRPLDGEAAPGRGAPVLEPLVWT